MKKLFVSIALIASYTGCMVAMEEQQDVFKKIGDSSVSMLNESKKLSKLAEDASEIYNKVTDIEVIQNQIDDLKRPDQAPLLSKEAIESIERLRNDYKNDQKKLRAEITESAFELAKKLAEFQKALNEQLNALINSLADLPE